MSRGTIPIAFLVLCSMVPLPLQQVLGDVRVEARDDWMTRAGTCVLAPFSCPPTSNCIKIEDKFVEGVQEILPVDDPGKLRTAIFERSIESPTPEEVLALAEELGYDSVLFVGVFHTYSPSVTVGTARASKDPVDAGSPRLVLKAVDGTNLLDGFTSSGFTARQLLKILEGAQERK